MRNLETDNGCHATTDHLANHDRLAKFPNPFGNTVFDVSPLASDANVVPGARPAAWFNVGLQKAPPTPPPKPTANSTAIWR
jgi:hypothetical protein